MTCFYSIAMPTITADCSFRSYKLHVHQYTEALLDHRTLCKHQHGFLYGRLCLTNLLEFLDNWTAILATGNVVDIAFLDLCKAFDLVSHE